jgi:hypothetical protein
MNIYSNYKEKRTKGFYENTDSKSWCKETLQFKKGCMFKYGKLSFGERR